MDQKKQETYARYANYTNKTLWQYLDNPVLDLVDREIIMMIIKGRTK